ncbi:MAG: hypothetical protein ACXVEF_36360 [Polyangiales bacterium]
MKRALSVLFFGSILAFGVPSAGDEASDAKMAEEQMVLLEKLADLVSADKHDCSKMAADMNAYLDKNKERLKALKAWSKALPPAQKKAIETKYQARAIAAANKMHPGLNACAKNEGVKSALERLGKGG